MTTTIDNAFRDLWRAVKSTVPVNPDSAIYKAWQQNYRDWGSPLGNEVVLTSGGVYQVFANAIVTWHPDMGVEVVAGP
jgi:uncharacterized protein with LGFP repeats